MSEDDEAQIGAVVGFYNEAAENLDGSLLCDQVLQPSLVNESCAGKFDKSMAKHPEGWERPIEDLTNIEVKGSAASARGEQDGAPIDLTFVREDGRWWMKVFD